MRLLWLLLCFVVSSWGGDNDKAVSTHIAPADWVEVFVCTIDGSVHSLDAFTGDVLWSYSTEPSRHNEQLSFMAQGQNFTFYPDRRKGDIYTSRDGKTYAPFPPAKKLVEMSPFQWDEGKAIFLAKKSYKRFFVDPTSGTEISAPSPFQCEVEPSASSASAPTPMPSSSSLGGRSRWLEIIRTDYDIIAEQILEMDSSFYLTRANSFPRELEVLKFSVSDYKLFLRSSQVLEEEMVSSVLPRLTDVGGIEGGTIQAIDPVSRQAMWQRKFAFPLTHSAHVLIKSGNREYLSNVEVEDASFEYLAIGDGNGKLVPFFGDIGGEKPSVPDDSRSLPFPEEGRLLPAPPSSLSDVQIAVIIGAIFGGIIVLALILFYLKCLRKRRPPPSPVLTPIAASLPASPAFPSASASTPDISPLPLSPNLTSLTSSRYVREFEELGGLEGEEGKNLGRGGYGTVVRVRNITDDTIYAVKKVRKFGDLSSAEIEQILREVKLLAKLDHPNIVRYFASWVEEEEVPRGVEKEEEDGRSITRTITLTPPRTKRKIARVTTTILETVTTAPLSSFDEMGDDFLGFEFAPSEEKCDGDGEGELRASGGSASSLSSLSSQPSIASQLSELSELSRKLSTDSLGPLAHSSNASVSDSQSSLRQQLLSQPSSISPLMLDVSTPQGSQKQWTLFIQMQLCSSGTLEHWMARVGRKVEPELNLLIFKQIVSALRYVHDPPHGLIHRDLKPANIFMMDDRSARVGDFGLSKRTHRMEAGCGSAEESLSHTAGVGSPLYCSPEQLAGREYTNKTDIFSLGVIFVEMHHVFSTKMERNICLQDYRRYRLPQSPSHMFGPTSALGQFVRQLLHPDPSQRPTAQQILEHDIFKASSS